MIRKGFTPVAGVRLKYRTTGDGWVQAIAWLDEEHNCVLATFNLTFSEDPGDPRYQAWVDATSACFAAWLERTIGVSGIATFRQAPNYKGE